MTKPKLFSFKAFFMFENTTLSRQRTQFLSAVIFFCAFGVFALTAQAQGFGGDFSNNPRVYGTVQSPQGEVHKTPDRLAPQLVRLTYYRPGPAPIPGSARLEVNGRYHTTLQVGSYTEVCLPAGQFDLGVRLVQTGLPFETFAPSTVSVELRASEHLFVRVVDRVDGRAQLALMDGSSAQQEIRATKRQTHAVSRLRRDVSCDLNTSPDLAPMVAQAAAPAVDREMVVLGVGSLFAFGRADFSAITTQGRRELNELADRLQAAHAKDNSLHVQVTGYADPHGNARSNLRLSELRAQAVHRFLVQKGVRSDRISSRGLGSRDLLVSNCSRAITPESIECNRPNRRVVVNTQMMAR